MPDTELSTSNAPAIMTLIEIMAGDSNCSGEKLQSLITMHNDLGKQDAARDYAKAMARCQSAMPSVATDAENKQTHSDYATLDGIVIKTKPIYTAHGFAVSFGTSEADKDGNIRIMAEAMHASGHSKHYHIDLPPDSAGIQGSVNKTNVHAAGSTFSYGKRYLFCMIFNIVIGGEDSDGVPVESSCTVEQAEKINSLCEKTGKTQEDCFIYLNSKFNTHYEGMANLAQSHAHHMIERLNHSLQKTAETA